MADYKSMYLKLANAVEDAIKIYNDGCQSAITILNKAKLDCEDIYINTDGTSTEN